MASDGIILSSPGYVQNVSALMKNFLDRFAYSLHRPAFFKQKVLLVANGGSGVGGTIKALSFALGGSQIVAKLGITATPWEATEQYAKIVAKQIHRSALILYRSILDTREKPIPLGNLIWFAIFKKMAAISLKTLPADHAYYQDKPKYFYPSTVNPFKNALAHLISIIALASLRKQIIFK